MPRSCGPCPTGCSKCSSGSSCSNCSNNLVKSGSTCVCNSTQNLYYNAAGKNCTSCSAAIPYCASCSSSGLSTSCSSCSSGSFKNTTSGLCQLCSPYCSTCTSSSCTLCVSSTFSISGTTCYCDASQQLFLTTSTSPNSCASCSSFVSNCQTCTAPSGTVLCQTCQGGYFPSGAACLACVPLCLSCTSLLNCASCAATFVSNGTDCVCGVGYVLNAAGTKCLLCDLLIPNCLTCISSGGGSYYCGACQDPFYEAVANATSCTLCPVECTSCTGPLACSTCVTGYSQSGGVCTCDNCVPCVAAVLVPNCAVCDATDCLTCEPGYFLNGGTGFCEVCPPGCATCLDGATCQACLSPFVFLSPSCECNTALEQYYDPILFTCSACAAIFGPSCTDCAGAGYTSACIACVTGTYLDNSSCTACPANSTACTSASVSTACQPTFSLVGGQCICDTTYQKFLDVLGGGTCLACPALVPYCASCLETNLTASMVGCAACQDGYYIDPGLTCSLCPPTCLTCTSPTQCVDCISSYALLNGSCECDPSAQMYEAGGYCAPCEIFIDYCLQCSGVGPSAVVCLSCVDGSYIDGTNTSCIACAPNCAVCDGSGCLNCSVGFQDVGGSCEFLDDCQAYTGMDVNCVDCNTNITFDNSTNTTVITVECLACQAGYYLFGSTSCIGCPSTCATCSDEFSCLLCQPTFTLRAGACVCNPYDNEF
jgi:proprotein convertase subtilisin/kexin type 5